MKTIFVQRNKQTRHFGWKQSGQASIEMVLILLISVIVILGLVYRFNTAFRKYTTDLYGTYYRCLLETGELPGVGVCRDRSARFAISNGSQLVTAREGGGGGSGGGSQGGSGSGSGGGKGSSGKDGKNAANAPTISGGGSEGGGSETVGGGRSAGGGTGSVIGRLRGLGKTRSTAVGTRENAGKDEAGGGGRGDPQAVSSRSSAENLRRAQTKMNFAMDGSDYQREETMAAAPVTASAKKSSQRDGNSLRPRKAVENTDRKPAATINEDKGGSLEFGRIFRLFLIFGIIVAIVIFLGGQLLQISKSGDQ